MHQRILSPTFGLDAGVLRCRMAAFAVILLSGIVPCPVCDQASSADAAHINTLGFNPWYPPELASRYYRSCANGRLWFSAELLGWGTKGGNRLPTLVTASPGGTPIADAGRLGLPTTSLLFGDEPVFDGLRVGGRLRVGWWFDLPQTVGVEGVFYGIDGEDIDAQFAADGVNILARPFFNVNTSLQDAVVVASPTTLVGADLVTANGSIDLTASMAFSGAEAVFRKLVSAGSAHRIELLAGYRYGQLRDSLLILETVDTTIVQPTGTTIEQDGVVTDLFDVENHFHGCELGISASRWWNRLALHVVGKLALGGSNRRLRIAGRTLGETTTTPVAGSPTVVAFDDPFGLLAQPSNIGRVDDSTVAIGTEFTVDLQYSITWRMKLNFGYTFLYWSDVVRALDQIDVGIDPTQSVARPRPSFNTTDFWAQGLQGGFTYQF